MAENSSIEWTDKTWNPITGCTKVSPGCAHCYAEGIAKRFWGDRKFSDVQFHPDRLEQPLRWRKPRMVFVNSMSDLFHSAVTDEQIDQIFAVMALTPHHTYQVLTKRPERMLDYCDGLTSRSGSLRFAAAIAHAAWILPDAIIDRCKRPLIDSLRDKGGDCLPLGNVWLGVTVENQKAVENRARSLYELHNRGWKTFYSAEPLLGKVELYLNHERVDWVIVGGESGRKSRPCDIGWIRSIVEQCQKSKVPVFVKQLGSNAVNLPVHCGRNGRSKGKMRHPGEWPEYLRVREFPDGTH